VSILGTATEDRAWGTQYASLLHDTIMWGNQRDSLHGGRVLDLGPTHFALDFLPRWVQVEGRGGSRALAAAEPLAYVAGLGTEVLLPLAPYLSEYRAHGGSGDWPGAYGPRIAERMPDVLRILADDPFSRQAVLHIHDSSDNVRAVAAHGGAADIPCTCTLVFYLEAWSGLCCHASMRSTDAYIGLYYDVPSFSFLARRVADVFGFRYGRFFFTTSSLHVYPTYVDKARQISSFPRVVGFPDSPWVYSKDVSYMARWEAMVVRAGDELRSMVDERASQPSPG
jgi:Thymidylate synthase